MKELISHTLDGDYQSAILHLAGKAGGAVGQQVAGAMKDLNKRVSDPSHHGPATAQTPAHAPGPQRPSRPQTPER